MYKGRIPSPGPSSFSALLHLQKTIQGSIPITGEGPLHPDHRHYLSSTPGSLALPGPYVIKQSFQLCVLGKIRFILQSAPSSSQTGNDMEIKRKEGRGADTHQHKIHKAKDN